MATTIPGMLRAFLLPFARHFRALGYQVDAMAYGATRDQQVREAFDHTWDVPWHRDPLHGDHVRAPFVVGDVLRRGRYDLFHVHSPVAGFLGRLGAALPGAHARVVYTAHGFHFHPRGRMLANATYLGLESLGARLTDLLVVMNEHDYREARRFMPEARLERTRGIGLDLGRYTRDAVAKEAVDRLRQELHLPPGTQVLLMVAEFIPRKRHRDVVLALARARSRDAVLVCVGDGPLLLETQAQAQRLLPGRCRFLGFRGDVPELLALATALVLPSIQEGLPRCVMEAMAMGVPVIGADVRGTADLISGGAGVLVPAADVGGLARAIDSVLADPTLVEQVTRTATDRIGEYDLEGVLAAYERLYAKVLAMPPRRASLSRERTVESRELD
jgi:glycosyltransferase involved in cell wall biosynthesis